MINKKRYKKTIKLLRDYCRLCKVRLEIRKDFDPEEDTLLTEKRVIHISASQPYDSIINKTLHEIGHYIDSIHHAKEFDSKEHLQATKKLIAREKFINKREELRKELFNLRFLTDLQRAAIQKRIDGLDLLPDEQMAYLALELDKRLPKKLKIIFMSPNEIDKKFRLSSEELELVVRIEKRAWVFGETVAGILQIKLPKSFKKLKEECLVLYQEM